MNPNIKRSIPWVIAVLTTMFNVVWFIVYRPKPVDSPPTVAKTIRIPEPTKSAPTTKPDTAGGLLPFRVKSTVMTNIDLSAYFTDHSTSLWPPRQPKDLLWKLKGKQEFDGFAFSIEGIIQLRAQLRSIYPERVNGIEIQKKAKVLHLLHGVGGQRADGVTVGLLTFRYADGEEREFEILYGRHVGHWNQDGEEPKPDPNSAIAWIDQDPRYTSESRKLRIYRTSIENPRPGFVIENMDYSATMLGCSPFLLALSVEE